MRSRGRLLLLALVTALPRAAAGAPPERGGPRASCPAQPAAGEPVVEVAPGPHYDASGFHRLIFGADYRQLWTTPVRVPVLDLAATTAGSARRTGRRPSRRCR